MPLLASIDIGSNAIRCAVGYLDETNKLVITGTSRESVRLGSDVFSSQFSQENVIKPETLKRASLAIKNLYDFCKSKGAERIRAVATSATRDAHNRKDFLEKIKTETGVKIEVINGIEEARLIQLAVKSTNILQDKLNLLLDIGGGSVEISLLKEGELILSDTVPLGAVRLLSIMERAKNPEKLINRYVKQISRSLLDQVVDDLKGEKITKLIATGGNLEEMGELCFRREITKTDTSLTIENVQQLIELLEKHTLEERITKLQLKPDRADVIYPAAVVLNEVVTTLNIKEIVLPKVGLKDGVLLDLLLKEKDKVQNNQNRSLQSFIVKLGRKYNLNQNHAKKVQELSLQIFEDLYTHYEFKEEERVILFLASYLHDIGQFISNEGHHKHSFSIILGTNFPEIDNETKLLVALVARYHRKSIPSEKHDNYKDLKEKDKIIVNKLASILRVADALDRSHENKVKSLKVSLREKECEFEIGASDSDYQLELWALEKKKDFFEKVYDRKIVIKE